MSDEQKQAIQDAVREVLLSEEFLAAFAKAFAEMPLPSRIETFGNSNHLATVTYTQ